MTIRYSSWQECYDSITYKEGLMPAIRDVVLEVIKTHADDIGANPLVIRPRFNIQQNRDFSWMLGVLNIKYTVKWDRETFHTFYVINRNNK